MKLLDPTVHFIENESESFDYLNISPRGNTYNN